MALFRQFYLKIAIFGLKVKIFDTCQNLKFKNIIEFWRKNSNEMICEISSKINFWTIIWLLQQCDARILVRSSLLLRLIMMMIGRRRSELLMRFQRLCTLQTLVANLSSTFEWGQKKSWMWQKIGTKLNSSIEDSRRRSIANFAIRIWLL